MYFPESSLKSIGGPRRIADTEGLYHISRGSYLKRLDNCEYKQSIWSGDQYNDTLESMDQVIAMQKQFAAMIFSVWSRQYCIQTEIIENE